MQQKKAVALILIFCLANVNVSAGWSLGDIVVGAVGAGLTIVAAPAVLTAAGFTAGGIAAGSAAAGMMSASATYGAGAGVVAVLQSTGAAGLGLAGTALAGATGAKAAKAAKDAIED